MSKTLRDMNPNNPPMTRGQRRAWLALEAQKRRRDRLPAILLASDGHGHLTWTINFTSPWDSINIYQSADGVTWGTDAFAWLGFAFGCAGLYRLGGLFSDLRL